MHAGLPSSELRFRSGSMPVIAVSSLQAMNEALEKKVAARASLKGHLDTYRFCDNVRGPHHCSHWLIPCGRPCITSNYVWIACRYFVLRLLGPVSCDTSRDSGSGWEVTGKRPDLWSLHI